MDYFMNAIHGNGFAPFRFLTPFPHHPSRRLRNSARQPSHSSPDAHVLNHPSRLPLRCSNILGGRFHRLPSMDNSVQEKRCWGIQGGMPHWSQDACPRRGGRERSERWKGEGEALSPPRRFGKAKSSRSLPPLPCILPTQFG